MSGSGSEAGPPRELPAEVAALHEGWPGLTEDLLTPARLPGPGGANPYEWLAAALPSTGLIVDVGCGSAPLAEVVGRGRYLGVDAHPRELAAALQRRPTLAGRLIRGQGLDPVRGPVAGVALSMVAMLLDLDRLLEQAAELTTPGDVLVATVPLRDRAVVGGTPYGRLLHAYGLLDQPFPESIDREALPRRISGFGWSMGSDVVREFVRPLTGPADRRLLLAQFYAADTPARARELVEGWASIGYPIRRIVAHRG